MYMPISKSPDFQRCFAICPKDGMRWKTDHRRDTPRDNRHVHLDLKENLCFLEREEKVSLIYLSVKTFNNSAESGVVL